MLSIFSLVLSLLCFIGVYFWGDWAAQSPIIIRLLLLAMGLVFLSSSISLANQKSWRYFYADKSGIHFPDECPETKSTRWLDVPWEHVGTIKKETFLSRTKGLSIELQLEENEANKYFRDIKLAKLLLGHVDRESGYFKVGYSNNVFNRLDDTISILNDFKKNHTNKALQ